MRELIIRPEGIFLAKMTQLNADDVKKLKKKTRNRLMRLHDAMKEINELETLLASLNSEEVTTWVKEADAKACAFLCELLGDQLYKELQTKGEISYNVNNTRFKITKAGSVFRGRSRTPLCIIRDKDLPLPDYISALLVNLRERRYQAIPQRRRR